MNNTGNSRVTPLEEGVMFVTKMMEADSGKALPEHQASIESVLIVIDGACSVAFEDDTRELEQGQSLIIPANRWHQITARPAFRAIHVMPGEIRFEFRKPTPRQA